MLLLHERKRHSNSSKPLPICAALPTLHQPLVQPASTLPYSALTSRMAEDHVEKVGAVDISTDTILRSTLCSSRLCTAWRVACLKENIVAGIGHDRTAEADLFCNAKLPIFRKQTHKLLESMTFADAQYYAASKRQKQQSIATLMETRSASCAFSDLAIPTFDHKRIQALRTTNFDEAKKEPTSKHSLSQAFIPCSGSWRRNRPQPCTVPRKNKSSADHGVTSVPSRKMQVTASANVYQTLTTANICEKMVLAVSGPGTTHTLRHGVSRSLNRMLDL